MKLYMKDGRLRFDYEFEQTDIFAEHDFDFSYLGNGIREYVPFYCNMKDCRYPYDLDWARLGTCVMLCKGAGVTITPEAQEYIDRFKAKAEADTERREADKARLKALIESAKAKAEWEYIQTHGCKGCQNLRYCGDLPRCNATGKDLAEENVSDYRKAGSYVDGVYNIFEFVPLPSEECPYKTEPMTEEEQKIYSRYKHHYA